MRKLELIKFSLCEDSSLEIKAKMPRFKGEGIEVAEETLEQLLHELGEHITYMFENFEPPTIEEDDIKRSIDALLSAIVDSMNK